MIKNLLYIVFLLLSVFSKYLLPSLSEKKMSHFTKLQFALLAFKYWVTKNYLIYKK